MEPTDPMLLLLLATGRPPNEEVPPVEVRRVVPPAGLLFGAGLPCLRVTRVFEEDFRNGQTNNF